MINSYFRLAQQVLLQLEKKGFQAYIVGGAVRDSILNRKVVDIDIATSALPEEVQSIFSKVIPTGIQHGTVLVRYQNESFEVTTFRTESTYSDSRHPDNVSFVSNLKEDLARRDFTMNAIAMNRSFDLIDPFQGQHDIEYKLIRTVGQAKERFLEDALRMMRAIRFQSQLGFKIEKSAFMAIEQNRQGLSKIAVERIAAEWEKTIKGNYFNEAIKTLFSTRLYQNLPLIGNNKQLIQAIKELHKPIPSFAAFIAYMNISVQEIEVTDWIKEWKLSNQIKKESKKLVQLLSQYPTEALRWVVYQLPYHLIEDFSVLTDLCSRKTISQQEVIKLRKSLSIQSRKELAIDGNDVISFFPERNKGSWIQDLLSQVEHGVVLGKIDNTKIAIREWLKYG
ncbi:CCA tRNA nucleotidyltransferase [Gracilibacillus kekensis]|uniref:CCA-adding enzyme n=1 Tax=Gracilibacillus kekensis TaxID=1027249 RepID=A0A1M7PPP0_9BACI|nr:CCA tRNA nucleotidyltransferase [Gracilibacillus kekensis]SHN19313.1 tRNA nucleotidyltransferase (CCA-adding enzyme) [Gracilibacillus kekensis]